MYEIQEELKEYYSELDPKKRLEILNSFPENESVNFLHELYHSRYSDHDNKGRKNVDWWLWRCICLHQLYSKGGLFRRFRDKEVKRIISELYMEDSSHQAILYHEYRNLARRYLSTCKSANYASSFMGFKKADDNEKVIRACKDIWQMSKGAAWSAGVEDEMHLWIEAFHDEIEDYDSLCKEEYERLNSKIRRK